MPTSSIGLGVFSFQRSRVILALIQRERRIIISAFELLFLSLVHPLTDYFLIDKTRGYKNVRISCLYLDFSIGFNRSCAEGPYRRTY